MNVTYQDLLMMIQVMTEEQRRMDVTIYVSGVSEFYPLVSEFYPLVSDYPFVVVNREIQNEFTPGLQESALDDGHPYLVI